MDLVCWLGVLTKIFTYVSILVSGLCMLYHYFYCTFSCYLPSTKPGLRYLYTAVVVLTGVIQWWQLALSKELNRVRVSLVTWAQKQIQLPKRCVDKVQKPSNSEWTAVDWIVSSHIFITQRHTWLRRDVCRSQGTIWKLKPNPRRMRCW
jgi:hypothetical protein